MNKVVLILDTGETFEGSPEEVVAMMQATAFCSADEPTPMAYMLGVARRIGLQKGKPVRTTSAIEFLEDLDAAGVAIVERS